MTNHISAFQNEFYTQASQLVDRWGQLVSRPSEINSLFGNLKHLFDQYYKNGRILNSTNPAATFIFGLKQKRGERVAAGAYAAILNAQMQIGGQPSSEFFEGIIEGFLFKREIDWTATGHREALDRLKSQYDAEIGRQNARFKELQETNRLLNDAFDKVLKEKSESLQKLHEGQTTEFHELVEKHVKNLTAIEKTYDQKLALQKPVKYWQTKENYHGGRSKLFGWVALVSTLLVGCGMAGLLHWVFAKLSPNENPKHWQIGVLVVAAFFSVWLVRVLVRLFFSNLHLATDAAERRMMILTYVAMSREGAQFTSDDKKLIVQHLFRSASDGLVKDDAAPPGVLELFTRR